MKKVGAILLFGVLCLQLLFSYGMYGILRYQAAEAIEQQMRTNLADIKLAVIQLTPANQHQVSFSWFSHDEFTYQGHNYDVVRKAVKGSTTYYYCIDDKRETELSQKLEIQLSDLEQHHQGEQNNTQQLLKKLQKEYTTTSQTVGILGYNIVEFVTNSKTLANLFSRALLLPPPKVLIA